MPVASRLLSFDRERALILPCPPLVTSRPRAAQRPGAELRSRDDSMLDQIPTEAIKHRKAPTDGVSSSDMLGA